MSSAGPSSGQFLFSDHNSLFLYTASLYYCLVFILVLLEPLTVSIYILSSHSSVITDNYLGTGSVLGNSSWGRDWFSWKQTEVESGMQVFWRALLGATSVRKWGSRSGQREKLTHNLVATETSADRSICLPESLWIPRQLEPEWPESMAICSGGGKFSQDFVNSLEWTRGRWPRGRGTVARRFGSPVRNRSRFGI